MKRLQRVLFGLSLLLFVTSFATCHFGVEHEINKIPAEHRARMSDFDWIGYEWIELGMLIFLVGMLSAGGAFLLWIVRKSRKGSRLLNRQVV